MRKFPVVEMELGSVVEECPPDGNYAVITHKSFDIAANRAVPATFPWIARIYAFSGGACDDIAHGSDVAAMLTDYNVARAYLVGVSAFDRRALEEKLAKKQIELVPEVSQSSPEKEKETAG